MRITTKGQVTIPRDIREKLAMFPHSDVEFVVVGNVVYLRKKDAGEGRGQRAVERMRGKATVRMTTDDILALTRGDE